MLSVRTRRLSAPVVLMWCGSGVLRMAMCVLVGSVLRMPMRT